MRRHNADRLGMEGIATARQDYAMARRSGAQKVTRRGVPSGGAGADYHYRSESDWLWMCELAWEIYRNNMCVGSIVDRAVEQTLQNGFAYDPNSGDPKIDADLRDWWQEICEQPQECDPAWEMSFYEQEEIALRATLVAGDIFAIPQEDGTVGLVESQFCRSPSRKTKENIVHGVEQQVDTRRRLNYWFLNQPIDPYSLAITKSQLASTPAYYDDDLTGQPERNVFHIRFVKRANQTRGITALAPIFDTAGYHDDVQFLKMVQARASSLFVFVRNRSAVFDPAYLAAEQKLGPDVTAQKAQDIGDQERQYRSVAAGSDLRSLPGENITPWSSNVPNPEFFPHARLLLTFVGINLGMPLVMALMDASETTFSGYRGAIDQARMGFKKNQRRLIQRFHQPYLRFKILKRAERDAAFRKEVQKSLNPRTKINIFRHKWNAPNWPYIDPTKDAAADLMRDANMLTSPRRRNQERGMEFSEIARETVEDRSMAMRMALDEAQAIKGEYQLDTSIEQIARILAPLPMPERVSVVMREETQPLEVTTGEQQPATNNA